MSHVELAALSRIANLRDLGGVGTTDGRRVRRGVVYRSAMLDAGDTALVAQVGALGIRTIVDLRANQEREAWPTPWKAAGCAEYWCRDYDHDASNLLRMAEVRTDAAVALVREEMLRVYRAYPFAQRNAYRAAFEAVVAGRTPVLFHCAAGKDRTGVLAALILAAVDVPMTAIIDDYLLTNSFDLRAASIARGEHIAASEAALAPLLTADPAYLATMFEDVTARHGSVEAYLAKVLAMDDEARDRLRFVLTEPA